MKTTKQIANKVISELSDLGAYIANESYSTNSIYIKFNDERLRSLTIRDHNTIKKYRYKWNIRLDKKKSYEQIDKGAKRFIFSVNDLDKFYERIRIYHKSIILNS